MQSSKLLIWIILTLFLVSGCAQQGSEKVEEEPKMEPPELTYEEYQTTLTDEEYCSQFTEEDCPLDRCKLGGSCPICADTGCHAKDYDKDWPSEEELTDNE